MMTESVSGYRDETIRENIATVLICNDTVTILTDLSGTLYYRYTTVKLDKGVSEDVEGLRTVESGGEEFQRYVHALIDKEYAD